MSRYCCLSIQAVVLDYSDIVDSIFYYASQYFQFRLGLQHLWFWISHLWLVDWLFSCQLMILLSSACQKLTDFLGFPQAGGEFWGNAGKFWWDLKKSFLLFFARLHSFSQVWNTFPSWFPQWLLWKLQRKKVDGNSPGNANSNLFHFISPPPPTSSNCTVLYGSYWLKLFDNKQHNHSTTLLTITFYFTLNPILLVPSLLEKIKTAVWRHSIMVL